jgi:hypothetical protein
MTTMTVPPILALTFGMLRYDIPDWESYLRAMQYSLDWDEQAQHYRRELLPVSTEVVHQGYCTLRDWHIGCTDELPILCWNCGVQHGSCYGGKLLHGCDKCYDANATRTPSIQYYFNLAWPEHLLEQMYLTWYQQNNTAR